MWWSDQRSGSQPILELMIIVLLSLATFSQGAKPVKSTAKRGEVFAEEQLISHLMSSYVREARPVLRHSDAVDVTVKFSFVRIEDLNEATDTFGSSLFIVQIWKDPRLQWNVTDYQGVRTIRLPAAKIWVPDLVLYNVAYQQPPVSLYESTVTVTSDGTVVLVPMLTLYSTCPMDLRDFPYDEQSCSMVFGSWMYTSWEMNVTFIANQTEMDVVLNEEDSSYLAHQHPQWELVDNRARARLSLKKYECCQQPFTLITITTKLRRRPQFYRYLTVVPAAVLGLLVPVIYLVPANSQDKSTFGLLLLVCLTILMSILQQAIPFNHGSLPKICSFYLGTMILTCISIVASVITANISVRGGRRKPLPAWLHSIFLGRRSLRQILCIGDYGPVDNLYASYASSDMYFTSGSSNHAEETLQDLEGREAGVGGGGSVDQPLQGICNNTASAGGAVDKNLAPLTRYGKFIVGKMSADATYHNINQEWEELSRVIDRCLFVAFFILYIFTASSLL
ncbi:hypothetical protein PoB_001575700 [Plakobranchus ocellatus]|uniref:Uncharacterized protein n=1 Tax=Plakobranchus ocellatus TaxID=259542 RepID=A0AAV3Z228_9GAST|nr:hypothetical protein PoB_001575700 [Plakobranchus ocellatus]